jgi:hypothetical protein
VAGNLIDPNFDNAQYERTITVDTTPPEVVSASLTDSITLNIIFSENLDPALAGNINNYTITNGIQVLNASSSGSQVTLTTSEHSPGTYSVTINNVTDLAGNLINPNNNSADYELIQNPGELLQLQVVNVTASVIPEPIHGPEKTIDGMGYLDGDPDSRWSGDTMPEWISFDFGNVKSLGMTQLEFYNWNAGRIYNYTIQVSLDNINWTDVVVNGSSSSSQWTTNEFNLVDARYVRVVFNSSNQSDWAGLWEAQLWGLNSVTNINNGDQPHDYILEQNYPNPFNPGTTINFSITNESFVSLFVYNALGEIVSELVNETKQPGNYSIAFNAGNLPSGIYFYRIQAGTTIETKKMMLLK